MICLMICVKCDWGYVCDGNTIVNIYHQHVVVKLRIVHQHIAMLSRTHKYTNTCA